MIRKNLNIEATNLVSKLKFRLELPYYLQNRSNRHRIHKKYLALYAQFEHIKKVRSIIEPYLNKTRTDINMRTKSTAIVPDNVFRYIVWLNAWKAGGEKEPIKTIDDFPP